MKRILVIADDLTGAAEIGGIAHEHGLVATIFRDSLADTKSDALIIDTDSRHLLAALAAAKVQSVLEGVEVTGFDLIYKKTDSMLRGPVAVEILAAIESLHFDNAILVPQNPSRNRIIRDGRYFIHEIPLHESPVGVDVEHHPTTSDVSQLLDPTQAQNILCMRPGRPAAPAGITVGCAASPAEVQHWAAQRTGKTLLAGSGDFFAAALQSLGLSPVSKPPFTRTGGGTLVVFGSASNPSREFVARLAGSGAAICDISPGAKQKILDQLRSTGHAFIAARAAVERHRAAEVRRTTAELVAAVLSTVAVRTLVVEGGATASAILRHLSKVRLEITAVLAPGIDALRFADVDEPLLILKPGTYPWPDGLLPIASKL